MQQNSAKIYRPVFPPKSGTSKHWCVHLVLEHSDAVVKIESRQTDLEVWISCPSPEITYTLQRRGSQDCDLATRSLIDQNPLPPQHAHPQNSLLISIRMFTHSCQRKKQEVGQEGRADLAERVLAAVEVAVQLFSASLLQI